MSDIVQRSTEYRIKQIEIAEAKYYKTLVTSLDRIEREITALANKDLRRTSDGKLIELQAAIAIRPKIKAILDREYLAWSDTVVREGFNKQAKRVQKTFKGILERARKENKVSASDLAKFSELTKGDLALVQNLKQQYFTQFKDVSNTFTRRLSEITYQNVLAGNDFTELEKELRQTINGIYASSDDAEANTLVEYINRNKYVKSRQSQVDKAIQTLQTKFARDRAGENMKRYAGQILNDSLRDFDATLNFNKSNDAGLTFVKYYGDVIPTTRDLCRNLVNGVYNKRKGGLFTINEIRDLWQSRSWSGKKSGNPLVVRGGYNCRHQFSYVNPDWYDSKGELII
ncbi:MAG: hypothetical protein CBE35_00575 [Candidatus Pelagibacter sp. TMED275]|nr:MAG: hypothetical protein CBE35_00575 [Candidatus Pelagibacter sp. TMED275]